MPVVNALAREVVFKIVYYGPGLGGKTTSLQHVHATTKPEHRGKMVSLATPVDRTLYFDFLPIRVPNFEGPNRTPAAIYRARPSLLQRHPKTRTHGC